ncbi:phosphatase PAP2 family protein [Microvirga sp. BT325]|uniref:Phosphatase PAP2 family protein n=2 Tax=Microvirga splendida TaxID=2795727 RepID=A0ABS0Y4W3_9HYPH|nr:phosphatase PAP2 family protein [Microvirga splendida]
MHTGSHTGSVFRRLGRLEWPILVSMLVLAGAVWGFAELADAVVEGDTHAFDRMVLLALHSETDLADPLGPEWLEEMMRDFTALGGVGVLTLLTAAAAGYLLLTGKSRAALALVLSIGGGILLSSLVKTGFDRPRPDLVSHGSYVYTASFPSGHSMMAAVVYLTLGALIARVRPSRRVKAYVLSIAVLVTVLVGISRVYLGVHWPTDVLGGWATGAAWALLCWLGMLWFQRRGKIESEEQPSRI